MASIRLFARVSPFKTNFLPLRKVEELWKGSYLDPSINADEKKRNSVAGDAWPSVILKNKSFDDLHKLWYICLKEKNLLHSERWAAYQKGVKMEEPGRIKKCKLTMKRILGELSKREIHQQCLRGQNILEVQNKREVLETQSFHIQEEILKLKNYISKLPSENVEMRNLWKDNLENRQSEQNEIMLKLAPIRKETMQLVAPNWRYQRKYSDIPGHISWRKQKIRALLDQKRKPIKFY